MVASRRPQGHFCACPYSTEHRRWEQSRAPSQPTGRAPMSLSRSVTHISVTPQLTYHSGVCKPDTKLRQGLAVLCNGCTEPADTSFRSNFARSSLSVVQTHPGWVHHPVMRILNTTASLKPRTAHSEGTLDRWIELWGGVCRTEHRQWPCHIQSEVRAPGSRGHWGGVALSSPALGL